MTNTSRSRSLVLLAVASVVAGCARHSGDVAAVNVGSPPAFETRVEIATGSQTHADYRIADFDLDGVLDMAVVSLTGELRILIGNGAGFTVGQELQIDGLPSWMAGGDFDNDGDEDLVIVRSDADETNVYENDGSGQFTLAGTLAAGSDALSVAVGDLNRDGVLDIAVARPSAPEIVVGFGDGSLGFSGTQNLQLPGGGTAFNVSIGDADGDENADLVVADTAFSRLVVFTGAGPESTFGSEVFQLQVPGTAGAAIFGDLSGDGRDDIVVPAFTNNRYVVITDVQPTSNGNPPIYDYTSFDLDVPAQPSLCAIGDVTGDGLNDLVACLAFTATMAVVPADGVGGFGDPIVLDSTGLPLRPYLGDFDGNGRLDVFALSGLGNRVNLWLADDSGRLAGARSYATSVGGASWIEGGDFDGDGDSEIVAGSYAGDRISVLGGVGMLEEEAVIDVGASVYQLEAADLDLDGKLDLVVAVPGGVKILHNVSTPGTYAFDLLPSTVATIGTGTTPFGIEVGDFNGDGWMDIAACDYVGGGVHIAPGTALTFAFGDEIVINVGGGPIDLVAADFTGDGLQDFAVSRTNLSDIAILRNEGGLQFVETMTVPVGLSPNYLVTSDFNRDGRSDLVVSNAASGTVTVLFGAGNGFVGSDFAAGAAPTALLARDLTGDGIDDILVVSLQSGDFRVLVGNGQGGFPLLPSFPGTLGASDAVLQDMTGDGQPDLMVSSLISDRVSIVRNLREQ